MANVCEACFETETPAPDGRTQWLTPVTERMVRAGMSWTSQAQADFDAATGQEFGEVVCPPVHVGDASPHECCEAVWAVLGRDATPTMVMQLSEHQVASIALFFGNWFGTTPPSAQQVKWAVANTLARCPAQ